MDIGAIAESLDVRAVKGELAQCMRDIKEYRDSGAEKKLEHAHRHYIECYRRFRWMCLRMADDKNITFADFVWIIERLYILDKNFNVIKIKLKAPQIRMCRIVFDMLKAGDPIRIWLLKSRQWGGSTITSVLNYLMTWAAPGSSAKVISYENSSADWIYNMYVRMLEKDKIGLDKLSGRLTRTIKYKSGGELQSDSGYKLEIGRSTTLLGLHMSEVSMWREAAGAFLAVLQTVPDRPFTMVVGESTARGRGNFFHEFWEDRNNEYYKLFVSWLEDEDCVKPFKSERQKKELLEDLDNPRYSPEGEEEIYMREHGATAEQLHYRRYAIDNKTQGSVESFKQEYPTTADEAFLHSGRSVFSGSVISHLYARVEENKAKGGVWTGEVAISKNRINPHFYSSNIVPAKQGRLQIYKRPEPRGFYAVGVDVAEGIDLGTPGSEGKANTDNSVISVVEYGGIIGDGNEHSPVIQVAEWCGKVEPDDLAYVLHALLRYYNHANCGIEKNNHGLTTIKWLMKDTSLDRGEYEQKRGFCGAMELRYPVGRMMKTNIYDKRGKAIGKRIGWVTSSKTRPFLLDNMAAAIRNDQIYIYSEGLVQELQTFIDSDGRMEAERGKHDDRVFALAIALQVIKDMPRKKMENMREFREKSIKDKTFKIWRHGKPGESWAGFTVSG